MNLKKNEHLAFTFAFSSLYFVCWAVIWYMKKMREKSIWRCGGTWQPSIVALMLFFLYTFIVRLLFVLFCQPQKHANVSLITPKPFQRFIYLLSLYIIINIFALISVGSLFFPHSALNFVNREKTLSYFKVSRSCIKWIEIMGPFKYRTYLNRNPFHSIWHFVDAYVYLQNDNALYYLKII